MPQQGVIHVSSRKGAGRGQQQWVSGEVVAIRVYVCVRGGEMYWHNGRTVVIPW